MAAREEISSPTLSDLVSAFRSERRNQVSRVSVKMKRRYFGSAIDERLSEALDDLEDSLLEADWAAETGQPKDVVGRLREGCGLGLWGHSGVGKTRALERQFLNRPEFAGHGRTGEHCLLLSVKAPQPCTLKVLGERLLNEMGYPIGGSTREAKVWPVVMTQLRTRGIRYVHIDELQHVFLNKGGQEIDKVRGTLKTIMQESSPAVGLVVSGTPSARSLVQFETQNARRSQTIVIDTVNLDRDAERLRFMLRTFGADASLKLSTGVLSDDFLKRLIHASCDAFGTACDTARDAAKLAIREEAKELEVRHFGRAWEKRIACTPEQNVFHVDGWASIDARTLLRIALVPEPEPRRPRNVRVPRSDT